MENITDIQQGFNFAQLLGFLGLLAIIVLIIIYLIKPNYQQKFIPSTYVWKLSLKYRRKKIPINQLKNLIIIICQILIICMCAFIMAKPYVGAEGSLNSEEKIIIIEASANMQAVNADGISRFDRAVDDAKIVGQDAIGKNGRVSIILAGKTPTVVVSKAESSAVLLDYMDDLECTYSVADISAAMQIAESALQSNPSAEVILYTDTTYLAPGKVTVKMISEIDESFKSVWNAAILDVSVTKGILGGTGEVDHDERYHIFSVKVASFGKSIKFNVNVIIDGIKNAKVKRLQLSSNGLDDFEFIDGEVQELIFNRHPDWVDIEWFEKAEVYIDAVDSFASDNQYFVYGKMREELTIRYISTDATNPDRLRPLHNKFINSSLTGIKNVLSDTWDINIFANEMVPFDRAYFPPYGGADVYIFEHYMPEYIPTDGIVILINPDVLPDNLEHSPKLGGWQGSVDSSGEIVSGGQAARPVANGKSPILDNFDPSIISITKFIELIYDSAQYQSIFYDVFTSHPLMLVRNSDQQKVAILPFSVHNSTLPVVLEAPLLFFNIFNYFMPPTLTQHVYDIDDDIAVSPRGYDMLLRHQSGQNLHPSAQDDENIRFESSELPYNFVASQMGSYFINFSFLDSPQDFYSAEFFVKVAESESNFNRVVSDFIPPVGPKEERVPWDLIIFFASALIGLLFIERIIDSVDL